MEKQKCSLCKKEKSIKEFRFNASQKKKPFKICRRCETKRDSELWL